MASCCHVSLPEVKGPIGKQEESGLLGGHLARQGVGPGWLTLTFSKACLYLILKASVSLGR